MRKIFILLVSLIFTAGVFAQQPAAPKKEEPKKEKKEEHQHKDHHKEHKKEEKKK